jgi:hypothetical protein
MFDWLSHALAADTRLSVGKFIPAGYAAYARIMHPPYHVTSTGETVSVRWEDIAATHGRTIHDEVRRVGINGQPSGCAYWRDGGTPEAVNVGDHAMWHTPASLGHLPEEICAAILPALRAATTSTQLFAFVWEGFGGTDYLRRPVLGACELGLFRRCFVYACTFDEVFQLVDDPYIITPTLWHPADRAWCVTTDIDHTWSYIGGSQQLINELRGNDELEIVPVSRDADL